MTTYKTKCGGMIDLLEHTEAHLKAHPEVINLLASAIEMINLPNIGQNYEGVIDMGRPIGRLGLVKTSLLKDGDKAFFALRTGRKMPSRVVPASNKEEKTSKIVILADWKEKDKKYVLKTAWIGELAKKEPWDPSISNTKDFKESLDFWKSFALIHDPKVMGGIFESSWSKILANLIINRSKKIASK